MKNIKLPQKLAESGLMLALSTILSIFMIAKLPFGGDITLASMLPMIIIAYRYGFKWGLITGATYGLIQMLIGMQNLSYATSAGAAIAIVMLDYVLAFAAIALGAVFRNKPDQVSALSYGALLVCLVRFICHVISGCTVWAGISIPTFAAFVYSLLYNLTFMLPETIITCVAAVYLGSALNFRTKRLSVGKGLNAPKPVGVMTAASGLVILGAVAAVVAIIFTKLQNESGEFDITGIREVNMAVVAIIIGAAAAAVLAMYLICKAIVKKQKKS